MRSAGWHRTVPWRLVVSFAAFALTTFVLGTLVHRQAKEWSERVATEALRSTVRLGAHGMDLWMAERFADADVFADNPFVRHSLQRAAEGVDGRAPVGADIVGSLESIRRRYNYRSASLIDTTDQSIAYASGQAPSAQDIALAADARPTQRVQWVDLMPRSSVQEYRAAILRRIADDGAISRYLLLLEVEPLHLVRTLIESRPSDMRGESILMRRQGSNLLRFAPERDPGGTVLVFLSDVDPGSVEHKLLTEPSQLAKGLSLGGRSVLAMREPLSLPGWHLVSMLDESAVLASLRHQTRLAIIFYGVVLATVAAGLVHWVRSERFRQTEREANVVEFYDQILRHGDALFILADWRGKVVDASYSALVNFGYTESEMHGRDIMDLVPVNARDEVREMVRDMEIGETRQFVGERLRASGDTFFVEGSVGLLEIRGRRYFHSVGKDVTREREVQTRLNLAASVFDLAPAAILIADKKLTIVSVNPAFTEITGYGAHEVVGQAVQALMTGVNPEQAQEILSTIKGGHFWEGEILGRRKNGELYPRRMLAAAHHDRKGEPDRYISIFTDLTLLKQAEVKAEFAANHDQLTLLPNRRRLDQLLPNLLRTCLERGTTMTLALFNIDRFKSVNDSLGLVLGDALLVEVAKRLTEICPPRALFHLGADEFVALLEGSPVGHALTVDRALGQLCSKVALGNHGFAPSASVGMASYPEMAEDAGALLRNAYAALRSAKAQGGKAWRLYEPGMNDSSYDDMLIAVDLRTAIDEGQLELHFQPQARISDWVLVGMEALLRWKHPTRGAVPPGRFVPIAEASGLIDDLSRWVMGESCRIWSEWRNEGLHPPAMAVNVSPLQFKHASFIQDVARTIARHDITPHCLVLELTESLLMEDSERAIGTMHRLSAMGVRIALDDFGTGYSSLSYLTRFPMDKLKIDRSFIIPIGTTNAREAEAIVKSVISMAQALQLRVIAEGVELQEQADFLRANGCDEIQGYLFARPLSAPDFRQLLIDTLERRQNAPASSIHLLS